MVIPDFLSVDLTDDEKKFAESAIRGNHISEANLEKAVLAKAGLRAGLAIACVKIGIMSDDVVARVLADIHGLEYLDGDELEYASNEISGISRDFLRINNVVPLSFDGSILRVLVADPSAKFVLRAIEVASSATVEINVGALGRIEKLIQLDSESRVSDQEVSSLENGQDADFRSHLKDIASEAPVIKMVSDLFNGIVERGASDLHIEAMNRGLVYRFRVDGEIQVAGEVPQSLSMAVVSRIKLLAGLDIAERRLPQDGRIQSKIKGNDLDLRVSIIPTVTGESLVVRALDKSRMRVQLGSIGFNLTREGEIRRLLSSPHGIILVVGPTGSGKTTTLYAALSAFDSSKLKVITIEDPVEYQLEGINQIQIQASINLTFGRALRSILRQDPDVILVGEMRDSETAQIATQAALTGHLVLSTLHTNTAASAIVRLKDLGIPHYLISSSLIGVLSQRLIRVLCDKCKAPINELEVSDLYQKYGDLDLTGGTFFKAVGCKHCAQKGYRGRTVISELIVVDDLVRSMLSKDIDTVEFEEVLRTKGHRTLFIDGLEKVRAGLTTLEEVVRSGMD
ncbi:MAG: type II/IV secretion system protein [Burkholderiaceae bacterium]|nr:type II/IV secretion system protein [Burkholderiaceae bacterium]